MRLVTVGKAVGRGECRGGGGGSEVGRGGLAVKVGGWVTGLLVSEYTVMMLEHQSMAVGSCLSGSDMRSVRLGKVKQQL